jgi:hypothetical protein
MVTISSCDIDRVLRGSRNRVMKMDSEGKFSSEFFAPCNCPGDPANKPNLLSSACVMGCLAFLRCTLITVSHRLSQAGSE